MKRLLLVVVALASSPGLAHADTWTVVATPALPSAAQANGSSVAFPLDLSAKPLQPQQLGSDELRAIWQAAGAAYGVPWAVLAAINKIETNFGENMGPSSAGAVGWMQFMPGTWRGYGTDGNGDGVADPWNAEDAIYSAARYLAASGAQTDLRRAVFAYNHADWYVADVLNLAALYDAGGTALALALSTVGTDLTGAVIAAEQRVAAAESALEEARTQLEPLVRVRRELLEAAKGEELISDRLENEQQAAQVGVELTARRHDVERLTEELRSAEAELAAARSGSTGLSVGPTTGYVGSAPSFQGDRVFPVGGGAELVSVLETHQDYPAADIAAPAGSPVYALGQVAVLQAWSEPEGVCGIGASVQAEDGLTWTYCHLAYLDPAVVPGANLVAGAFMGLVGETGEASGPYLGLQLEPATSYPQEQAWFAAFAGQAFRWQGASSEPVGSVFEVAAGDTDSTAPVLLPNR
jgi:murein DD-endopeptidase MepM/ murein hydrolase activator NlpD